MKDSKPSTPTTKVGIIAKGHSGELRSGRKFNFVSAQSADQVIDAIQRARR